MPKVNEIKTELWVAWIGATVAAAITMTFVLLTFAYGQFETKDTANLRAAALAQRFEAVEKKIDALGGFEPGMPIRRTPGSR